MLVSAPGAGASQTGLDLIGDQQGAARLGQFARGIEELLRYRPYAALALNRLDEHGADVARKFGPQIVHIVEAHKFDSGRQRREGFAVFLLVGGRKRAHGAPMKAVVEGEKTTADRVALALPQPGIGARQFKRSFPRLGSAVAEESAVQSGSLRQAQRQFGLALMEIEIGDVHQLAALPGDGIFNHRASIAQGIDANAAHQVQVLIALVVNQVNIMAADTK